MRTTNAAPMPLRAHTVPLLDATFLPAEEDWAVLEALHANVDGFESDEDRFAGFGLSAGDFD